MKLAYLGTPEMAVPPLVALVEAGHSVEAVVTRPDTRRGRGVAMSPSPVKAAATDLGLHVTDRVDDLVGDGDAGGYFGVDLGVVVAFGRIIRPHVLEAVPMVNLHFSLLPRWRGAAPVERAILAGDERTGVDLMVVEEGLDLGGHLLDVLRGLPTLRAFGRERVQAEQVLKAGEHYRVGTMATLREAFLSAFVLEFVAMLGTALVAVACGLRLAQGQMEFGPAIAALVLAPEVFLPLRRLGSEFHAGADGVAAAERIYKALDAGGDEPDLGGGTLNAGRWELDAGDDQAALPASPGSGSLIELVGVDFAHPGREPVLCGSELRVEAGERVAIVGPSGCGKSTLFSLILGLIRPDAGRITVDGEEPAGPARARWHRQVAWVPQRPLLIAASLADNVRLARPDADDEAVLEAIARARLEPLLGELPEGLETRIGEGGRRLSAGQRQRVALARAFLSSAPVVILDEPTANLDRETGAEVAAALVELTRGRTALVASHRLEGVAIADRVLELRAGRLEPLVTAVAA